MPLIGRKSLNKAIDKAVDNQNSKLTVIYSEGLGNIIKPSPVYFKDGGSFKNGWFLSVGSPSSKTRDASRGGEGSYAEILRMPTNVLGKKIYFTNNTPQAMPIEYGGFKNPVSKGTNTSETKGRPTYQKLSVNGFSRQAPGGVVRVELVKMRKRIKKL